MVCLVLERGEWNGPVPFYRSRIVPFLCLFVFLRVKVDDIRMAQLQKGPTEDKTKHLGPPATRQHRRE